MTPEAEKAPQSAPHADGAGSDTERALAEALEERNRLWAELHELRARQRELEYLESVREQLTGSLYWRVAETWRGAMRLLEQLVGDTAATRARARRRIERGRRGG